MMDIRFELLIQALGKTYEELIAEQVVVDCPLEEIFPDSLGSLVILEKGISLDFWSETSRYEAFHIQLKEKGSWAPKYDGALPHPFSSILTQSDVRRVFGTPMEAKKPYRLPLPVGLNGGRDSYLYRQTDERIKMSFLYDEDLTVSSISFSLTDRRHD